MEDSDEVIIKVFSFNLEVSLDVGMGDWVGERTVDKIRVRCIYTEGSLVLWSRKTESGF